VPWIKRDALAVAAGSLSPAGRRPPERSWSLSGPHACEDAAQFGRVIDAPGEKTLRDAPNLHIITAVHEPGHARESYAGVVSLDHERVDGLAEAWAMLMHQKRHSARKVIGGKVIGVGPRARPNVDRQRVEVDEKLSRFLVIRRQRWTERRRTTRLSRSFLVARAFREHALDIGSTNRATVAACRRDQALLV
jgi:hypothetical protein